ncbi:cytochrome P450 [Trametes coccinea BRFM310]|uniref:Cytochrome P450 n=1 Tax=Trametes coccinea (strain BRFM310) TaxID=1353009 RepID=A0A1Y2IBH4_TRAC3|nr:cytochrome P450 [Trametes coccinea BRFM310]
MSFSGALWAFAVLYVVWKASALVRGRANTLAAIAGPAKEHWLTGNFHRIFKDGLQYNLHLFRRYGSVIKVHGMLGVEQLLVYDPLALQHILVKDADAFEETDMFIETNKLLFGDGLISTLGQQHRKQRKLLNPVFSLANLRAVLPRIQPIANELVDRLRSGLPQDGGAVEMDLLPWLRMGTIEYVGRGILGIDFNCLDPAKASDYVNAISTVQHVAIRALLLRPFVPWVVRHLSLYWRNMLVDWSPFPALRELREMARLMDKAARQMFLSKKAEVENAGHDPEGSTTDLMSIMIRANSSTEDNARLSEDELVGQINTFALAGQETTTSALARLLWVLAQEPPAQTRLRSEVREAKITHARAIGMNESEWQRVSLPYDVLIGLPYLDAVVRETLRLYPSTNMMYRVATKDATLPLHRPIRSSTGEELSTVYVPKGTNVIISILGANRNTHVWGPDANEWRPERWLAPASESDNAENRAPRDLDFGDESVMSATLGPDASSESKNVRYPGVFGSMMTFLGGSRACLGFKFAEMEIKQILATLISTMHFDLPSAVDGQGERKEVYWRIDGLQVPVVRPPHGDLRTAQAPFDIRLVKDEDFLL